MDEDFNFLRCNIYIYIYIYICVCVCVYLIYIESSYLILKSTELFIPFDDPILSKYLTDQVFNYPSAYTLFPIDCPHCAYKNHVNIADLHFCVRCNFERNQIIKTTAYYRWQCQKCKKYSISPVSGFLRVFNSDDIERFNVAIAKISEDFAQAIIAAENKSYDVAWNFCLAILHHLTSNYGLSESANLKECVICLYDKKLILVNNFNSIINITDPKLNKVPQVACFVDFISLLLPLWCISVGNAIGANSI